MNYGLKGKYKFKSVRTTKFDGKKVRTLWKTYYSHLLFVLNVPIKLHCTFTFSLTSIVSQFLVTWESCFIDLYLSSLIKVHRRGVYFIFYYSYKLIVHIYKITGTCWDLNNKSNNANWISIFINRCLMVRQTKV